MDENDSNGGPGGGRDGAGLGGGDDEPTLVIVPRIPRPIVSKGIKFLATAFGELRRSLFEFTELFDEATAMGAIEMTGTEAAELDEFLTDAKARINGVQSSLKRAVRPATDHETKETT